MSQWFYSVPFPRKVQERTLNIFTSKEIMSLMDSEMVLGVEGYRTGNIGEENEAMCKGHPVSLKQSWK